MSDPHARRLLGRPTAVLAAAALTAAASLASLLQLPQALAAGAIDPAADRQVVARDPAAAAIEVSRARRAADGAVPLVVLARADLFADALAASPLLGEGVLLFTAGDALSPGVGEELDRVLAPDGEVLVAGGTEAVAEAVLDAVAARGHTTRRVAGMDRVLTSIAFADEVVARGGSGARAVIARAFGAGTSAWADSVAVASFAAATGTPVLLAPTERLPDATRAWLETQGTVRTEVLGGPAALAPEVEAALPGPHRVAGADREATSAAIARDLVGIDEEHPRALAVHDAWAADGWAWGLLAASRVADLGGATLGLRDGQPGPEVRALLTACETPAVRLYGAAHPDDLTRGEFARLARLDGTCPGEDGRTAEGYAVSSVVVGPIGTGPVRRYTVEVQPETGVALDDVRTLVVDALLDDRSWTQRFTLQQVGPGEAVDVRIVLATTAEVDRRCRAVGLNTAGRYSCWDGRRALLNLDRYRTGTPDFDDLATYRRYLVNHEVGHGLGMGHVGCPAAGAPAPVMMQQTISVGSCVPNGWPFP